MMQCLRSGLRLTSATEREEIKRVVAERTADIPDEDLGVLGYHDFAEAISRGIAAHHAGMLAAFKEVVEELFARGLIKVVFATETLALGINMPARTVVLEKLSKWNGETHADITPGEYTQLTGRAGRRGIDVEGHAVVLWQPGFDPRAVAGLASTRTYPLRSSFAPSYNMAVNLVRQVGRSRARDMLELSFAQFQSDQAVVGLARQVQRNTEALEGYAESIECHLGDFMEYARLRRRISEYEASGVEAAQDRPASRGAAVAGGPADRRHHPGTGRAQRRVRARARPRYALRARGPAADRADRGPAGPAAVDGRLPAPGGLDREDAGAVEVQPAQPAAAPRARPGTAQPHRPARPTTCRPRPARPAATRSLPPTTRS